MFVPFTLRSGESAVCMFPCSIRPGGIWNPTRLFLYADFYEDALTHYSVAAIDESGNIILNGTGNSYHPTDYRIWDFAPPSPVAIAGFRATLDDSGGTITYTAGEVIASGGLLLNGSFVIVSGLTPGAVYTIENVGGPWRSKLIPSQNNYVVEYGDWIATGGNLGWSINNGGTLYHDSLIKWEDIDGLHVRVYVQVGGTELRLRPGGLSIESGNAPGTGSCGYIIRQANAVANRIIQIGPSKLFNVCDA
jgi:hypothetical protein